MQQEKMRGSKDGDDTSILHRKAAAWAWYQHQHGKRNRGARGGSSPLHPSLASKIALQSRDYPSDHLQQGSRFRSEAHKQNTVVNADRSLALLSLLPREQTPKCFQRQRKDGKQTDPDLWDCGSTLYDSFELLTLSNQLGRCLTTVHAVASIPSSTAKKSETTNTQRPFSFSRILPIPRFFPFSKTPDSNPVIYSHKSDKPGLKKAFQSILKSFHNKVPDSAKQYNGLGEGKYPKKCIRSGGHSQEQNHKVADGKHPKKSIKTSSQQHDREQKQEQEHEHDHKHLHHHHHHHHHHHFTSPPTIKPRKPLQPKLSNGLYGPFLPTDVKSAKQPVTHLSVVKQHVSVKKT